MNQEAKDFLLSIDREDCKNFRLAFSCKITKEKITTDRVCIIYQKEPLDVILHILHMLTNNIKIEEWVTGLFCVGKTVIFSFTGSVRKIYIEKLKGVPSNDRFFNESIEWCVGDEDNFIHRNYTFCKQDSSKYLDLIPPEFFKYLTFDQCLLRTDNQVYIRHKKIDGKISPITTEISKSLMKMALNVQNDLNDVKKHENLVKFRKWLMIHSKRKANFNWVQVTEDNMTVYVC